MVSMESLSILAVNALILLSKVNLHKSKPRIRPHLSFVNLTVESLWIHT